MPGQSSNQGMILFIHFPSSRTGGFAYLWRILYSK